MNLGRLFAMRWNEPGKSVAMLVFVIALGLLVAQIIFFVRDERLVSPGKPLSSVQPNKKTVDLGSPLFKIPLFGTYTAPLSEADIKPSTLDIQIVGIMYAGDEKRSQVLIGDANQENHVYGVGDSLPGGAEIRKIGKKSIVVLYNGQLERLTLPQNELRFDKPAAPLIDKE